jgi:hypothetical protein
MSIYKVGEFAEKIGVSISTLQRWDRTDVLKSRRTPTNQRYYTDEDLNKVLNLETETKSKRKNVGYCRVLSNDQKQYLENQKEFVSVYSLSHGVILDEIYTDIDSGLNYKRKNWSTLLKLVENNEIDKIYVTYKDRFVRFGYEWFEDFCTSHGTEIIVLNQKQTSPAEELTEDLLSILHVFSERNNDLKKYKIEINKELKEINEKKDERD